MSASLGNKLKTLVGNYTSNERPVNFLFATMVTPTQIQLDGSEGPIPEFMCLIPENLRIPYKIQIEASFHGEDHSGEITIDNTLKAGDRVIVLQKPGGQQYLILGRL